MSYFVLPFMFTGIHLLTEIIDVVYYLKVSFRGFTSSWVFHKGVKPALHRRHALP